MSGLPKEPKREIILARSQGGMNLQGKGKQGESVKKEGEYVFTRGNLYSIVCGVWGVTFVLSSFS